MPVTVRGKSKRKSGQTSRGAGCVFFGFFFLIGSVVFAGFFWGMFLPAWRANTKYVEGRAVVLDKRVLESRGGEGGTTYRPEISIRYTVGDREFQAWTYDAAGVYSSGREGKQKVIDQFTVGQEYPCWYDPDDPSKSVLVRGFAWTMLIPLFPLLFVVIGLVGMIYSLRAGGAKRKRNTADAEFGSIDDAGPPIRPDADSAIEKYPTVPVKDLSDHPLRPGEAYQVFVSQSGNLQINVLRVRLVCEEAATYRAGTKTSADFGRTNGAARSSARTAPENRRCWRRCSRRYERVTFDL